MISRVKPIPDNSSTVIPRLFCRDPAAAIDFCCVAALGAVELGRRPAPDGTVGHALLTIRSAMIMIEAEWPALPSRAPAVEDLRHWDRALAEGASGRRPLVARMLTRPTLPNGDTIPYAYGIRKESYRGLPTLPRGGHSNGMRTEIIRFPEQQLTVATLCIEVRLWAGQRAERVADVYLDDVMQPRRVSAKSALPPVVPITTAEIQQYVGIYHAPGELDRGRISILDDKLIELLGDTAQTFSYRGDGLFTADGIPGDFRLAFSRDSSGTMRMSYVSEGVVGIAWERMPDSAIWRPDASALADYAGTYFNAELDAVWQLAVRHRDLVLLRPGRPNGPFVPMHQDVFSRHFGLWNEPLIASFEFSRDAAGRITGFTITTPAGEDVVRNLRFASEQ